MGETYPPRESDPDSNSGRDCDWAAGGSGALASVYAVGGDIIFKELIGKTHTDMPKCDMGMGDEKKTTRPCAGLRWVRIVASYVLLHPPTSAEKGGKNNSRADRIVVSYVISPGLYIIHLHPHPRGRNTRLRKC